MKKVSLDNLNSVFAAASQNCALYLPVDAEAGVAKYEKWEDGKPYDRLGVDEETMTILDIKVPALTIPVHPGRNLAVILEVAAMNNRNKRMGHNAAKELSDKLYRTMLAQQNPEEND